MKAGRRDAPHRREKQEQAHAYAQFPADLSDTKLAQFFYHDAADVVLLDERRGDYDRRSVALHICTLRYLGTFLADLRATHPWW